MVPSSIDFRSKYHIHVVNLFVCVCKYSVFAHFVYDKRLLIHTRILLVIFYSAGHLTVTYEKFMNF